MNKRSFSKGRSPGQRSQTQEAKPGHRTPKKHSNADTGKRAPRPKDASTTNQLRPEENNRIEERRTARQGRKRAQAKLRRAAIAEAQQRDREERQKRERELEQELTAFIGGIDQARSADLLDAWRKYVPIVDYIRRTGHNRRRLALYTRMLQAIESEWWRRGKLNRDQEGYFDWPTTLKKLGSGVLGNIDWVMHGLFSYLGYHVGTAKGLPANERQAILRRVFSMQLPPIDTPAYVAGWGRPNMAPRLQKMAETLAAFVRNAKGRTDADMSSAITDWEFDLEMLYDEYYVSKFQFDWPRM